jgi:raffinose/stachyose/melibiose transport system permease protein
MWREIVCVVLDINHDEYSRKIRYKKIFSKMTLIGFLFAVPAIVSNMIFDWVPTLDGIVKSFYTWSVKNPQPVFVGLDNFKHVLTDPEFIASIKNMLFFFAANLVLMLPNIICCVVLFRIKSERSKFVYRVLLCLQMVVPALVFTLMWIFILGYDFGAINNLLVHLGFNRVMFLGNKDLIKWTIIFTGIPFVSANTTLIYLGGLNGVSESVWEAAALDGVGPIRKFLKLELPLISGQFKLNLIGVIGASITSYSQQLVYYNASVHEGIITPGLLMYFKAFPIAGSPDYGYSYALGLILFIVAFTISLISMKLIKSDDN